MKRSWSTVARLTMVGALALLLTGCLKLDMDLKVNADDTVSGSVVFAVSKDVLELTGGSAEDLLGGDSPFPTDEPGVSVSPYDDGEFAGQEFAFDAVPIAEFSDPSDPDALKIVREGDTFKVSGVLDMASGATGATGATGLGGEQFFESAEIRVAITFPGEVIDSNGTVEGNTVTWEPKFGERLELQATGSAIESGGGSSTLMIVLIAVGAVVVIAIVAAIAMSRRKKGPGAEVAPEAGMAVPGTAVPPAVAPPSQPVEPTPPAEATPPAEQGGSEGGTLPPPPGQS